MHETCSKLNKRATGAMRKISSKSKRKTLQIALQDTSTSNKHSSTMSEICPELKIKIREQC